MSNSKDSGLVIEQLWHPGLPTQERLQATVYRGEPADLRARDLAISEMFEADCYRGIRHCLIARHDKPPDGGVWSSKKPLEPKVNYAENLATAMRKALYQPDAIRNALRGYEDQTFMTGEGVRLAEVSRGIVGVAPVADCLGICVGSRDGEGKSRITSGHILLAEGYSMEDVERHIVAHKGAQRIGLAIIGCELNRTLALTFGTSQDVEPGSAHYRKRVHEILGNDVAIESLLVRIQQSSTIDLAKGKHRTHAVFAATNDPTRLSYFYY